MTSTLKTHGRGTIGAVAALAAGLILATGAYAGPGAPDSAASEGGATAAMPVAQQNALVQKYCAVCHNDAHLNGGLTLEHFDTAHPDPGVAAMLVSKLTSGLSPEQVNAAHHDPSIAAMMDSKVKTGAMGAAGVPLPDKAALDALISALSAESVGAGAWIVNRTQYPTTQAPILTASILQEVPSPTDAGNTDMYRLTLTCRVDTHEAEMQLAWAPGGPPKDQVMSVAVDGKAPFTYKVEGGEKMFKGAVGTMGTGAALLYTTQENLGAANSAMPLPAQKLTITNLLPDETIVFPFGELPQTERQALSTCFAGNNTDE